MTPRFVDSEMSNWREQRVRDNIKALRIHIKIITDSERHITSMMTQSARGPVREERDARVAIFRMAAHIDRQCTLKESS